MTGVVVIGVVLALFAAGAVGYARRAGRVTHRRASTGVELAHRPTPHPRPRPAARRDLVSFDVPPPQLVDGPVSLRVEQPVAGGHGRHRRPDGELPPGVLGMTGIMRKLDAAAIAADARMQAAVDAETGRLPRVQP